MKMLVKKWGNSAAVRIPAAVLAETGLSIEQQVDVREENGRVVIEPLRRREFDIAKLVKGIRRANLHEFIDSGPAMGREVW
ncbi:MAG: AbrB/MazE/SpoVT family DNA-binding domain-containing protein [Casimicrobiaceae bacterium]